ADLAAERTIADFKRDIRTFRGCNTYDAGSQKRCGVLMTAIEFLRARIERREVYPVDEIFPGQVRETDRIGPAVPVEVNRASAARVQPFDQSECHGGAVALMDFR